jgi:hypothetical protein
MDNIEGVGQPKSCQPTIMDGIWVVCLAFFFIWSLLWVDHFMTDGQC